MGLRPLLQQATLLGQAGGGLHAPLGCYEKLGSKQRPPVSSSKSCPIVPAQQDTTWACCSHAGGLLAPAGQVYLSGLTSLSDARQPPESLCANPPGTASARRPLTMPPGSTRAPTWSALPQELVQQAASLLGDDDRWVGEAAGVLKALRGTPSRLAVRAGGRRDNTLAQQLSQAPASTLCAVQLRLRRLPTTLGCLFVRLGAWPPPPACRLAVMHVCAGWQAAVLAATELMPAPAVLTAPVLEVTGEHSLPHYHAAKVWIQQAHDEGITAAVDLLNKAAQLSPLVWHVKLEGFRDYVR